jgi:hypothetical protein
LDEERVRVTVRPPVEEVRVKLRAPAAEFELALREVRCLSTVDCQRLASRHVLVLREITYTAS